MGKSKKPKPKRAYLVLRCQTSAHICDGFGDAVELSLINKADKVLGACPIVSTKKRARELCEKGRFEFIEITLGERCTGWEVVKRG